MKEIEEVIDSLILNASLHKLTKKSLDEVAQRFNELLWNVDVETLILDENMNNKLKQANKIFDELGVN